MTGVQTCALPISGALLRHVGAVGRRDELKARMCRSLLRGRSDLRQQGRAYGDRVVRELLRPDMVAKLHWHRSQGHEVAIVSASLDCYLETIARHLKVEHLLCTRVEHDDAWCTGNLIGGNCRGPEKLRRIRAHFGESGYELWAYGDSAGDDDMLAAADHPHRVGRRRQS